METNTIINNALTISQKINKFISEKKINESFEVIEKFITETEKKSAEYQNIIYELNKRANGKSLQIQKESDKQKYLSNDLHANEAKLSSANGSLNEQHKQLQVKINEYKKEIDNLNSKKRELEKKSSTKNWEIWIPFYNIKVIADINALEKQINNKVSYINNELIPRLNKLENDINITQNNINQLKADISNISTIIDKIKKEITALKAEQTFLNNSQATCAAIRDYFITLKDNLKNVQLNKIDVESIVEWVDKSSFSTDIKKLAQTHEKQQKEIENTRNVLAKEDKDYLDKIYKTIN